MPFSVTSASLLRDVRAVCHFPPILRVSKLKCSQSSYDPESLEALSFLRLLVVRTDFTALATRVFSSSPSSGRFLVPWNLTLPAPPPQAVDQVYFMDLACASMTLHDFMS